MKNYINGLALVVLISVCAGFAARTEWAMQSHLGALTLAILFGLIVGNSCYKRIERYTGEGINFAKGRLLRLGIVLYGFNITLQDIGAVGVNAIATDVIMLVSTFFITSAIGKYYLKLDKQLVSLTATGCSICGAAAILGAQSVVKAESHKVSVAVALVVIFGTVSMFLYPVLHNVIGFLDEKQFGIYIGSTIHEVAQVYAAGKAINPSVADVAVISKMIRVMMLAPFLIVLSFYRQKQQTTETRGFTMPWFALLFILCAVINSTAWIPANIVGMLSAASSALLMVAMAALGVTTQISAIKQAGVKPLLLGGIVFVWLAVGGMAVNYVMQMIWH
ncbi:YeiH family protein [Pasteurellaceae bacterium LIM206]|nr:YeiH family protein [Pasteurellaceae bacterium LIM206]